MWFECACGTVVPERVAHCGAGVVSAVRKQCRKCGSKDVLPDGTHCGKQARPLWLMCGVCGSKCNPDGTHCLGLVGLNQYLTEVVGACVTLRGTVKVPMVCIRCPQPGNLCTQPPHPTASSS